MSNCCSMGAYLDAEIEDGGAESGADILGAWEQEDSQSITARTSESLDTRKIFMIGRF